MAAQSPIAYFSLEFGIDSNIPTYAGGLGILAADTLLEAASQNFPVVGIGMMYKGKRFIQKINEKGEQYEEATPFRLEGSSSFRRAEMAGRAARFQIQVGDDLVWAEAYKQRLGDNVILYLLTADVEGNSEYWRNLFDEIYWGGDEEQIKERIFFGIGGVSLLEALKIKPKLYHFQEGRPSFATLALMEQEYRKTKKPFSDLLSAVKQKVVYTNHTLVASGVHSYDVNLIEKYIRSYAERIDSNAEDIINLGKENDGRFHTTKYALNISHLASGVSKPHTALAQKRWPSFNWVNITNGVNLERWQQLEFGNPNISSQELWQIHMAKKHALMREVAARVGFGYDPNYMVVSWARRIAGYKHLENLFENIERLGAIVNTPEKPMMLLIAGKAHPGDEAGKNLIKKIIDHMKGTLASHAIFIHNYDIALARELVSGSDLWLNTPEFGREACGTSGMKAIANGVLQATVADGWAGEVEWNETGWVLNHERLSESLYETITEAQNLFFEKSEGVPEKWVEMMKKSILLAQKYSTKRMLGEYQQKLYKA